MADRPLILALDIGSSSVRAALYDDAAKLLPTTLVKIERKLRSTIDGGSEIDADVAFRQVVKAIDELLAKTKSTKGEITRIASCTFWHSLLGIDVSGNPTTPVLGWADNRSRDHVETLRQILDETETHNRTGARFHSSFWPAKLLWLKGGNASGSECAPFNETSHWISIGDYLTLKFTGDLATGVSIASGTGIFDIRENVWDENLLRFLKIKNTQLAPIADDSATLKLNSKYAKRWPRLADARWCLPVADGAANSIGSGCAGDGKAALMIGTSGAMRVVIDGPPPRSIPEGLWCYRVDNKRSILGGALSDGGGLIDWLRQNLNLPKNYEAAIAARTPAGHGLTLLPFFAGERSTGYNENAAGAVIGLTMSHDAVDIVQAAMESIAFRFRDIADQIDSVCPIREIIGSGGALLNSPTWAQMIADALGREITLSDPPEASMRGAVLLALESTGKIQFTDSDF